MSWSPTTMKILLTIVVSLKKLELQERAKEREAEIKLKELQLREKELEMQLRLKELAGTLLF